jgi:hypothetical protein
MVKGRQSSASLGTRKKHARKAAGQPLQEPPPKDKKGKKDKGKNKEPRQKVFIPPVKPPPIQADPLDTLGLASQLPPELYVVLKKVGKKDEVTKGKALEELEVGWLEKCRKEGQDSALVISLLTMVPVWVRHAIIASGFAIHSLLDAPRPFAIHTSFETDPLLGGGTAFLSITNTRHP